MELWLIVPVKPFHQGKSRLAAALSARDRAQLSRQLLEHVLQVASRVEELAGVVVISRDAQALAQARKFAQAQVLHEDRAIREEWGHAQDRPGEPGLNQALTQAQAFAQAQGADAVLVLPADLPLLGPEDVRLLYRRGLEGPDRVVMAPSDDGGTNALLLRPPGAIPFRFGPDSCWRHWQLAQDRGLSVEVVSTSGLTLDLDAPRDLLRLKLDQAGAAPDPPLPFLQANASGPQALR